MSTCTELMMIDLPDHCFSKLYRGGAIPLTMTQHCWHDLVRSLDDLASASYVSTLPWWPGARSDAQWNAGSRWHWPHCQVRSWSCRGLRDVEVASVEYGQPRSVKVIKLRLFLDDNYMEDPQIAAIANVWKLTENNRGVTQDETRLGENQLNLLCRAEKLIQVRRKKLICPCMTVSLWRSSLKRIIHCRWLSEPMSVSWSGPQEVLMIWWFTALLEFTWKRKFNMNQHFYALIS